MKKLSVIILLAVSFSLMSCENIQGNQSTDQPVIENAGDTSGDKTSKQATPEYLTYESFKEKVWDFEKNPQEWEYKGEVPCVIDFYADWCKPCKMVAPIMDDLARTYDGKVKIYKIDTDKEKKLAGVFGIRSIPSVLFSPMQGRPMMQSGALPKADYIKIIEDELLNKKQ
ncbi:MAG: thiol reductase thioredoxin [Bacteroidetes bacterium]|nr:thiol reductase thioredoxin [Bacteroidota bacterium]MBL6943695.1 thiol reductase thioredoxin [Bacteroidales bacterium]